MRVREPINAGSHLLGLVFAAAGTVALLQVARGPSQVVAFAPGAPAAAAPHPGSHRDLLPHRGHLYPGRAGDAARAVGLGAAGRGVGHRRRGDRAR